MKQTSKISVSEETLFSRLLEWLGENPSESAKMYQFIHNKLMMYFSARGCAEAEELADKTIDRVSQKVISPDFEFSGNKMKYFFGFAKNIHLEYLNKRHLQLNEDTVPEDVFTNEEPSFDDEILRIELSLKRCLSKLDANERKLLLKYYGVKKGREKHFRKKIAKKYKLTTNSMRVKVFRLKKIVAECIKNHLES